MGCDIHAYIEHNQFDGEPLYWPFADIHFQRDYCLFAHMAGVRNYQSLTPVAEPRGLPETVSFTVRSEWKSWESDAHDTSWLTLDELRMVYSQHESAELEAVIHMMSVLEKAGWKPRLVFWFDN